MEVILVVLVLAGLFWFVTGIDPISGCIGCLLAYIWIVAALLLFLTAAVAVIAGPAEAWNFFKGYIEWVLSGAG